MLRWYYEFRAASEARQLNRDAPLIIEHAQELFRPEILIEIAGFVRQHVDRAHHQYGTSQIDLKRAHQDYKRLHKEARRRADQVALSSLTLTIIYLRAEIAGLGADRARLAIEGFVNDYLSSDKIADA